MKPKNLIEYHLLILECRPLVQKLCSSKEGYDFSALSELVEKISTLTFTDPTKLPKGRVSKYPKFKENQERIKLFQSK